MECFLLIDAVSFCKQLLCPSALWTTAAWFIMIGINGLFAFILQIKGFSSASTTLRPSNRRFIHPPPPLYSASPSSHFPSPSFPFCLPSPQKHEGQLSVMQLMDMLTGVASGMKYLTEMGFVHKRLAAHKVREQVGGDDRERGRGGWCTSRQVDHRTQFVLMWKHLRQSLACRFLFECFMKGQCRGKPLLSHPGLTVWHFPKRARLSNCECSDHIAENEEQDHLFL